MVAVVVTRNPGPWLEDDAAVPRRPGLPGLAVLVVDAAPRTTPPTASPRPLPDAFVRRLAGAVGLRGRRQRGARRRRRSARSSCFCHDDVVLDPDAVRLHGRGGVPVERRHRRARSSSTPTTPRCCSRSGAAIDRFGVPAHRDRARRARPGAARRASATCSTCRARRCSCAPTCSASSAASIPRAFPGAEDLDLCWRARLAGARVLVAPDARVRHHEAAADRGDARPRPTPSRMARTGSAPCSRCSSSLDAAVGRAGRRRRARSSRRRLLTVTLRRRRVRPRSAPGGGTCGTSGACAGAAQGAPRPAHRRPRAARAPGRAAARLAGFVVAPRRDRGARRARSPTRAAPPSSAGHRRHPPAAAIALVAGARAGLAHRLAPAAHRRRSGRRHASRAGRASLDLLVDVHVGLALHGPGLGDGRAAGARGDGRAQHDSVRRRRARAHARRRARVPGRRRRRVPADAGISASLRSGGRGRRSRTRSIPCPAERDRRRTARAAGAVRAGAVPGRRSCCDTPSGYAARSSVDAPLTGLLGLGALLAFTTRVVSARPARCCSRSAVAVDARRDRSSVGCASACGCSSRRPSRIVIAVVLLFPWSSALLGAGDDPAALGFAFRPALDLSDVMRFQSGPAGAGWAGWGLVAAAALRARCSVGARASRGRRAPGSWRSSGGRWSGCRRGSLPTTRCPPRRPALTLAALGHGARRRAGRERLRRRRPPERLRLARRRSPPSPRAGLARRRRSASPPTPVDGRWGAPRRRLARSARRSCESERDSGGFRVLWVGDPTRAPARSVRRSTTGTATCSPGTVRVTHGELWRRPTETADEPGRRGGRRWPPSVAPSRLGHLVAPMGVRYVAVPTGSGPTGVPAGAAGTGCAPHSTSQLDLARLEAPPGLVLYENTAWIPTPGTVRRADADEVPLGSTNPTARRAARRPRRCYARARLARRRPRRPVPDGAVERGVRRRLEGHDRRREAPPRRSRSDGRTASRCPNAGRCRSTYDGQLRRYGADRAPGRAVADVRCSSRGAASPSAARRPSVEAPERPTCDRAAPSHRPRRGGPPARTPGRERRRLASAARCRAVHRDRGRVRASAARRTRRRRAPATRSPRPCRPSPSPTPCPRPWYCAEGTASPGGRADETIIIANVGSADARAVVTVMRGRTGRAGVPTRGRRREAGRCVFRSSSVAPDARAVPTRRASCVGPGVVVEVFGGGSIVEHEIEGRRVTSRSGRAPREAGRDWYFAAGTTERGAEADARAVQPVPRRRDRRSDLRHRRRRAGAGRPPGARRAAPQPAHGAGAATSCAARRRSRRTRHVRTGRIVAEQSLTFTTENETRRGLTLSLGAPSPSRVVEPAGGRWRRTARRTPCSWRTSTPPRPRSRSLRDSTSRRSIAPVGGAGGGQVGGGRRPRVARRSGAPLAFDVRTTRASRRSWSKSSRRGRPPAAATGSATTMASARAGAGLGVRGGPARTRGRRRRRACSTPVARA